MTEKSLTVIKGQPTSAEVRASLREEGRPVLVAFSGGKDAICAALALKAEGIPVKLAHLYLVPGKLDPAHPGRRSLEFVERSLEKLEDQLGEPVHRYPHPSLFRWLNALVYQPPERCEIIEAARFPEMTYDQTWEFVREDLGLAPDTWIADGVRAGDSIARRASLTRHGVMKPTSRKVSVIADWLIADIRGAMAAAGVDLPDEYQHFGRSFDGLDARFLEPMGRAYPEDLEQVFHWFPLARLSLIRSSLEPLDLEIPNA